MSGQDAVKKPPSMPGWLAVCFGVVGLTETTREMYSEKSIAPQPAKSPLPPTASKPATDWRQIPLVKDYSLFKQIGKGGFSEIWLSEHNVTKETVALKVVQLASSDLEPEEVATLIAEAKFLRALDCPYLIKCSETAHNEDWLILVLEYISGGEMLEHIHRVKKYTEAEAAKMFAQIVSAISYLHNLNVIHRDIKPENIMFSQPVEQCEAEGRPLRVKVIDLGMATQYDPNKPVVGCVGTPGFVAPEVWHDKPHTFALDIYALGVVLFVMLTGRKPHSGLDIRKMTYCNKSINDAPGLKDDRFLALSSAARSLLLSMLADDPRVRPSCWDVLRHEFITAVDSNAEAQREMGETVRRRMRDLARIRKLHGLRYAMHVQRPAGATQQAFLQLLDQRRLRLKNSGESTSISTSTATAPSSSSDVPSMLRSSLCGSYDDGPESGVAGTPGRGLASRISYDGDGDGGGGGAGGVGNVGGVNKMALLAALPEMQHSHTMPPVRLGGWQPDLATVPSCEPSAYGNLEDALLPSGWSAYPAMYEALAHRDTLMKAMEPGGGVAPDQGRSPGTGAGPASRPAAAEAAEVEPAAGAGKAEAAAAGPEVTEPAKATEPGARGQA